jgi:thiamine pyrophosphate-dependent acetolactate synthase large subunit-like protein
MNRLGATRIVLDIIAGAPVVASLGHPAYDLFAAGDRPANFYTWGSMGLASSIGLGVAIGRADLRVVVLDGDGSLLMNLGSLATIASMDVPNLVLIVWDNEEYGTTGGQPTPTSAGADLAGAAHALGIAHSVLARTEEDLRAAVGSAMRERGPWVIVAKVAESRPAAKPPLDCVFIKQRFMEAIGSTEAATRGGAA